MSIGDASYERGRSRRETGPRFLKVFYGNDMFGAALPHASRALLFALASKMSYSSAGGAVHLTKRVKDEISKKYGLSSSSIDKGLPFLVSKGYLYRIGRGEYIINPHLIAKGDMRAVEALQDEWDSLLGADPKNGATVRETASENKTAPA